MISFDYYSLNVQQYSYFFQGKLKIEQVNFYVELIEEWEKKRLVKYDYLCDTLYNGRNHSERIVFEWLTPEEKATSIAENIASIELIDFPEEIIR